MNERAQGWFGTLLFGGLSGLSVENVNALLQLLIGLASLAWWVRLWLKNPNKKPPGKNDNENSD